MLDVRIQDPLVGRDVFIGVPGGSAFQILNKLSLLSSSQLGEPPIPFGFTPSPWGTWLDSLLRVRYVAGKLLTVQLHAVYEIRRY